MLLEPKILTKFERCGAKYPHGHDLEVGVGDGHRLHDVLQFFETSLKHRIVKK